MEFLEANKDYNNIDALVRRVGRIFGYDGLNISIEPGGGWYTAASSDSIKLAVDPLMLRPKDLKDAMGNAVESSHTIPEEHYMIYGTCHELGHIEDYLDPATDIEQQKRRSQSDSFFWNVLDDAVINRRLTNIPLLGSITNRVYEEILFPIEDYTSLPKHIQFMYGVLLRSVTPHRDVQMSKDVEKAMTLLDELRSGRKRYELYNELSDPFTTLKQRRGIAGTFIKPIYDSFLEEDNQQEEQSSQPQSQEAESQGSPGGGSEWQESYEAYSQATPCGQHDHGQPGDSNANNSEGDGDGDFHQAIEKAGEALGRQQQMNNQARADQGQAGAQKNVSAAGAGDIASELHLSQADALQYQNAIEQYRPQISQVSQIFQKLALPTVEYTSPRYTRRPTTEGSHLSPRDLFRVAVARYEDQTPAIWRSVDTIAKKEGLTFSGLDVHLVVDASGSMQGGRAKGAASCFVMLAEGLEAACREIKRYDKAAPRPDVRLQVILFSGSAKVIAPLSQEVDPQKKGLAFSTILDAGGNSTLVADALKETKRCADQYPERTQFVCIITDGDFYDDMKAQAIVSSAPGNYYPVQYILNSPGTGPITKNYAHIDDAKNLPIHLGDQIERLSRSLTR